MYEKSDIRTFGIIGGDKRQLFLAKSISDSCYDVLLGGFDRLKSHGSLSLCNVKKAISESDALIFPLPSIRTDGSLNTPFSNENILLDGDDIEIILKKPVFTTMKSRFLKAYPRLSDGEIFDYGARDDLQFSTHCLRQRVQLNVQCENMRERFRAVSVLLRDSAESEKFLLTSLFYSEQMLP